MSQDINNLSPRLILSDKGISFDRTTFIAYVRAGNRDVVKNFLDAGMHVDTVDDQGTNAVAVAVSSGHKQLARFLLERGASDTGLLEPIAKEPSKKDLWDKLSSVSSLMSGAIVASIGLYATSTYNSRQLDLQEAQRNSDIKVRRVQTIEKFFPYLVDEKESTKEGALLAIAALGDEKLATSLATHFRGQGATAALQRLSESSNKSIAREAQEALAGTALIESLRRSTMLVENIYSPNGIAGVYRSTGFLISKDGYILTTAQVFPEAYDLGSNQVFVKGSEREAKYEPATVIKFDKNMDLVLLKVEALNSNMSTLTITSAPPKAGQEYLWGGFYYDGYFSIQRGILSKLNDDRFVVYGAISGDISGAPIVDKNGNVIGIVRGRRDDSNWIDVAPSKLIGSFVNDVIK